MTQLDVSLLDQPIPAAPQSFADEAGGIVDFWGVVRGVEAGRAICGIEYEAHRSMAEHQLRAIADEAAREFALEELILRHRIGFVAVGEASLFLRVGSRHRAAAFQASAWIVDELKKRATIWKHPRFVSGDEAMRKTAAATPL
ncbi:MAG TPA: molybdenum cofactor biosynthesis protein MoaE [Chthoniobacterales bacterium]|jgi:molybdopterin synthase catalytic subunit